jgi:ABC-type dipeptide/oligopeptide/nickel transport system permease subunit
MDNQEVSAYIISALSKDQDPNDIILALCEKHKLTWPEAETLVKKVQLENEQTIVKKKFPLLFVLALAIFLGGMIAIGYGVEIIFSEYTLIQPGLAHIQGILNNEDVFTNMYTGLRMILSSGSLPISIIIVGIGMILGSLIGMQDAWSDILK